MKPNDLLILSDKEWLSYANLYQKYLPISYQIGGESMQSFLSKKGYTKADFAWIQTEIIKPSFQHICFRYRSNIYSILIAIQGLLASYPDKFIVSQQDYDNLVENVKNII